MSANPTADQIWHALLDGQFSWDKERRRYGLFPANYRCKNCNAPFDGIGTWYARLTGRGQFSRMMNQFSKTATNVLIKTDAYIDKSVGDKVIGLYFPWFAGKNHAGMAIQAAQDLLWASSCAGAHTVLPIGVGVHTGVAYVGSVSGTAGSA